METGPITGFIGLGLSLVVALLVWSMRISSSTELMFLYLLMKKATRIRFLFGNLHKMYVTMPCIGHGYGACFSQPISMCFMFVFGSEDKK